MSKNFFEYATVEVFVTTCSGIVPIEGASVTVTYDGLPDGQGARSETHITNKEGRAEPFKMMTRRVKIKDRYIDFPKNKGCNIAIEADGYVLTSAKNVPIFPKITVRRSFDLIPVS